MSEQNQPEQPSNVSPLESIKNEISHKLNGEHKKSISWNSLIVTAVLTILTVMSLGQTVFAMKLFNKLEGGKINGSTVAPQSNSLESQPDMVGGC